jgi:hypothetical protein
MREHAVEGLLTRVSGGADDSRCRHWPIMHRWRVLCDMQAHDALGCR